MAWNLIPLAIAALAAGTGAQMYGQRQTRKANARAFNLYADRSDRRTDEAKAIFEKSLGQQDVQTQQQRVDDAAAAKTQRVDDLISRESSYIDPLLPGQDRAPQVIKSQVSRSLADELARARAQIGALAKLEGFSTRTFDRGLELDHVKPQLGNLGIFAEGDRNIFQAQAAKAAHAGDNAKLIGDILTTLGAMGLTAGAGGAGAGSSSIISGTGGSLEWLRPMTAVV